MTEVLENYQLVEMYRWMERHVDDCKIHRYSLLTSHASGIGESVYIKCECGEQLDLTDYGRW